MNIKDKLSSRKLWAAIAGVVMGLAMVFGLDAGTIETVSGAVVSVASIIMYIRTEGKIDAAAVRMAADVVEELGPVFAEDGEAGGSE